MGFFDFIFGSGSSSSYGSVSQETARKITSDWENISVLLKQKGPSQLKQALIMADKSLDAVLKEMVPGETMGERLKNAVEKFDRSTYNRIWDAHKLRNSLVHEAGFEPAYFMITEAVSNLKEAIYKLGVNV
ncbi:MAG: hypothetical protein UU64_C0002G0018 [candidate division WWE3 bacterium GW2011_GWF2_41_45]|uniref:DUF4145 domain-containing protein n=3 Tax=Katanobacteria TaxID=422282 RepID=A0A1F4W3C8_UNCKA|nr:MAG: hypothetical protein UU55_C0001G0100 [candidate division WWE3 bacterium GW2011_GWC2_41_23]KKS10616.1 MAG: hypothetical protein UU64_C0002G0018 [candidate division WWE3 bacterium GW2011_GWF2_41_45]KKS12373.1 MAG: hypothetical protein UU68_C0002G0099 [candidate division WWE3 bacterium GW2011_GWF1_41_53]KKS20447.1 MAG: hypothetical protein UU79_C0001G0101 [candidate division WWE3 bacterium GW2011_GWE1_41_72]KKS27282.1 MAG: hypothetical protein UU86_C0022G0017 [candidate division WWE3 bacte